MRGRGAPPPGSARRGRSVALGAVIAVLAGAGAGVGWNMLEDETGAGPEAEAQAAAERREMVSTQLERRGIRSRPVLEAMRQVPRHLFVPDSLRHMAYDDGPLPIGHHQTISQPYIVALMTEALEVAPGERVLEVGTGSGYQTAILSRIAGEVYTVEIVEPLGRASESLLRRLGCDNVHVRIGDGYQGWPEHAPYDAIIVTAAPDHVPEPLIAQLKVGGRLVIPIGRGEQELWLLTRTRDGLKRRALTPVRFVPMTGEATDIVP